MRGSKESFDIRMEEVDQGGIDRFRDTCVLSGEKSLEGKTMLW